MTLYTYRAATADDRMLEGQIEAATAGDAEARLLDRGLFPLSISTHGWSLAAILQTEIGRRGLSTKECANMLSDLAHLCRTGVEVAEALVVLSAAGSSRSQAVLDKLSSAVRDGQPLSGALAKCGVFSPRVIAVVRASESSGALAEALQQLAHDMRREVEFRTKILTALIYPTCVALAATVALVVLLAVVIPSLESLFADAAGRLPWQTKALIDTSHALRSHQMGIATACILSVAAFVFAWRKAEFRIRLERVGLKLPPVRSLMRAAETSVVARLLALLAAARVPLAVSVGLAKEAALFGVSRQALQKIEAKLRAGGSLSSGISGVPTLSPRLAALAEIGELNGHLPDMLDEAARGADEQLTIITQRLLTALTPAMTVLFGVVAGFVLYGVMTAILSVNELAGGR